MIIQALLTGGSGLLGKELYKYLDCIGPRRNELDISYPVQRLDIEFNTVIHAAAFTNVIKAETERRECFKVNVEGTKNMLDVYPDKKFIYISSEYARNPQNFYSWTKLCGEELVRKHPNHLIIRTSFIDNPFPHKEAFADQYTQGDYVEVIAPMIAKEILLGTTGLVYIGTGRKTMFELARRTVPDIKGISVDDIKSVKLPYDYE